MKSKKAILYLISVLVTFVAAALLFGGIQSGWFTKQMSGQKQVVIVSGFFGIPDQTDYNYLTTKRMNQKYPYIKFVNDITKGATYNNEYIRQAAVISGQQPFLYMIPFTDNKKYAGWGRAADITKQMKDYGYDQSIAPKVLDLVTVDGKYYGLPRWIYHMGLIVNRKLFEEAGLTDENGYPIYPDTYQDLVDIAVKIKKSTGKAGFFFANTQGQGGWEFMNIAWSNGVEFMKEENGKVVSTFNSPQCVEALQYVKDLKWKYDVLPEETFGDNQDFINMFKAGEVAIGFFSSSEIPAYTDNMPDKYNSVAFTKIPKGPMGRYSLCGGTILIFNPNATQEQLDTSFLWFDEYGYNDHTDKESIKKMEERVKSQTGTFVGYVTDSVFDSQEYYNARADIEKKYANFDSNIITNFAKQDDVIQRMEYTYYPQELYRILDTVIQTVMTDKNADCEALILQANEKFNTEYLSKINS